MDGHRESIIKNALRSFCVSFMAILGIAIAFMIVMFLISFAMHPDMQPKKSQPVLAADANGNRTLLHGSAPVILRLNVHGVIGEPQLNQNSFENQLLDSREGIFQDDRVKGIFLHINTPGGTAVDSDGIYQSLLRYKEKYQVPIYAFVNGICASGGMFIAAAADKIYATPESMIGSVGVRMGPAFNVMGAMTKLGIQALTITEGKGKDALNPFRPWKPDEDASFRDMMAATYNRFVTIVTTARPDLSREKLVNDYGAKVFIAETAKEYGYVDDANSNYNAALSALVAACGIDENTAYQVFQLEPPHSFLSDLAQQASPLLKGKIVHTFQLGSYTTSDMSGKLLYLYEPMELFYHQ